MAKRRFRPWVFMGVFTTTVSVAFLAISIATFHWVELLSENAVAGPLGIEHRSPLDDIPLKRRERDSYNVCLALSICCAGCAFLAFVCQLVVVCAWPPRWNCATTAIFITCVIGMIFGAITPLYLIKKTTVSLYRGDLLLTWGTYLWFFGNVALFSTVVIAIFDIFLPLGHPD